MNTSSLNSITSEYIKSITNNGVFSRGLSYFRSGRVLNLKYRDGELAAKVSGSEPFPYSVSIHAAEEEIYDMDCTCLYASDGDICKHIVATLLQWIENRNKRSAYKPLLPRKPKFFNPLPFIIPKLKDIEEPDSFPFFDNNPTHILSEIFSAFGDFNLKADLLNGGPQLELKLVSDMGDESVLHISAARSPYIFEKLKDTYGTNVELSERARQTKIYKTPLVPHLHADINDQGHIELSPILKLKGANKKEQVFRPEQLHNYKISDEWTWLNNSYRPIAPIPHNFIPYFNNEKPLVYKEKDAVSFLKEDFNQLVFEPSFKPSERLKLAEVHDDPDVSYMQVEICDSDWLWLDPVYKVGKHTITLSEILACIDKHRCIRKDMDYIEIPKDILDLWQRGNGIIENGRIKMPKLGYLRTRAECDKKVKVTTCDETRKFLMKFDRITPPQPAPAVDSYKGELRAYQQSGYDWLWFLHTNSFNGILADEMGLGKTHQAMVAILSALQTEPNLPNLVICPTSVLDHWESKLQTYAPELKLTRFYGKERNSILSGNLPPVVLTTYSILSRDVEALSKVHWNYVVLDEAQKIKNHKTHMCKATKSLKARHRLALTGTPIENRLSELWSIFDFLMPGYLGSMEDFRKRYENPITKFQNNEKREILKKIIHPFKLRRLKKDVLTELPPKTEEKRYCTLSSAQIVMYKDIISERGSTLIAKLRDESQPVEYIHIFALLTKLKRLCDHPKLVLNGTTPKGTTSGKFELFKEIMEETLESGEKAVVFSQYLEMLDMIGDWLKNIGVKFESLRGSTVDRGKVVKRFQNDPDCNVFLGSLMAGGLGIDLTSASVVIHYDRWWNAAREDQATDRVHRIGQTRGVQVFKLI
ncbi:MAG TPA: DEAD/DEAH box helicase, partial [Candidatus Wunengus sp. YC63]|uniref:DEAD/DEAH box helicase n=1 Tax=Candidatus Wunengus sp. YC63 TaxID=3367699 RepID=UPI00402A090F